MRVRAGRLRWIVAGLIVIDTDDTSKETTPEASQNVGLPPDDVALGDEWPRRRAACYNAC